MTDVWDMTAITFLLALTVRSTLQHFCWNCRRDRGTFKGSLGVIETTNSLERDDDSHQEAKAEVVSPAILRVCEMTWYPR